MNNRTTTVLRPEGLEAFLRGGSGAVRCRTPACGIAVGLVAEKRITAVLSPEGLGTSLLLPCHLHAGLWAASRCGWTLRRSRRSTRTTRPTSSR